jgi:CRP/FNR family cyclic AMP-dependent transcriptional regulator
MRTVAELLDELPLLAALVPEHRATIAGCARNRVFDPGELLAREAAPADEFFILRAGTVAIETRDPARGALTIETLQAGELVGWSWLVPPFRSAFDARARVITHVLAFDGACLRSKCDADPALGYALLRLVAGVFTERLQTTRLRLLDVYGSGGHGRDC